MIRETVEPPPPRQSVGRSIGETSVANGVVMLLQIASGAIAARALGPTGRGELTAMQLWPSTLITFGSLGLMSAVSYYCGRQPRRAGSIAATAWILLMLLCLPLMGVGYVLMPWLLKNQSASVVTTARVLLLLLPVQFSGNMPFNALQGLGRFRLWNLVRTQFSVIWALFLLVVWIAGRRSASLVGVAYLAIMAIQTVSWAVAFFRTVPGPYRPEFHRAPEMFRYGLPAVATGIPQQLNLRLDQMLMGAFLAPRVLGLYTVAVSVSAVMAPLLTAVSQVMFSHLARLTDPGRQAHDTARALRFSVVVSFALAAGVLLVTPLLLPLVYGNDFRPAVPAALLLVVAGAIANLNVVAGECLRGMGLPRLPLIAEMLGLVFTFVLLGLLLKKYQLMGASIASLASYLTVLLTYLILLRNKTGLKVADLVILRAEEFRSFQDLFARGWFALRGVS